MKSLMNRWKIIFILFILGTFVCNAQTNVKYDSIAPYFEGLAAVKLNDKWGYVDENKKLVIPIQFKLVDPFSEGLAGVLDFSGKQGYIDKTGKLVIPYQFDGTGEFHEGLSWVQQIQIVNEKLKIKWGYIDKTGKEVIPVKYDYAKDFSFGYAFVKLEDKWYVINQKGEEFNFSMLDKELELRRLKVNEKIGYIDKADKLITPIKYDKADKFSDKTTALVLIGDKFGIVGKNGEIIEPKYTKIDKFKDGIAIVEIKESGGAYGYYYGYINEGGKEVIPCKYNRIIPSEDVFACLKKKFGDYAYYVDLFDKSGKQINSKQYVVGIDLSNFFSDGLIAVKYNDKWGYINKTGKEVIPIKYDEARSFNEGLAAVKLNEKWGFIDKIGKDVIPIKYEEAKSFNEGLAAVKLNGMYGYIDKTNKIAISFKYYNAWDFKGGSAMVSLGGMYNEIYIDKNGNKIANVEYDY